MGRIRTVKPEFFRHEELFDLERETKLPVRLAFAGLWTVCDREGRFKWRPRTLKVEVLPFDDLDFSRVLDALSTRGFVVKYTSGAEEYGFVPSWKNHQVINNREQGSTIPDPPNDVPIYKVDALTTRVTREEGATVTPLVHAHGEGKGKEGKGREGEKAPNTGAVLPDWIPADAWNGYLEMRKKIRKPITADGIKLAIRELEKLRAAGHDPKLILEQSILNSWQGLFEPRVDREAVRQAERNRNASVGAQREQRPLTEEEKRERDHGMRVADVELQNWNHLENGTLPVTTENTKWVGEKRARLSKAKLPPTDPRPKWFAAYMERADKVAQRTMKVPA